MQAAEGSAHELRRALVGQVSVSVLISAVLVPAIIWFANVPPPRTLGGSDGVIAGLAKATAPTVFLMTLLLTLGVQASVRKGSTRALSAGAFPWFKFVPRFVVARAFLFTLVSMAVLVPLGGGICALCDLYPMSKLAFAVVNVVYGAIVAMLVTPFIALAAMAGEQGAGTRPG